MQVGDLVKYKNGENICGLVIMLYLNRPSHQVKRFDAAEVLWHHESIARVEYLDRLEIISEYREK